MKITPEEKARLEEIYQYYFNHPLVQRMKNISMHRGSNCFEHSFKVAKKAVNRCKDRKVDLETLLIASILHDYYLYDWRVHPELKKGHGRRHPYLAAKKAKEDFNVSYEVQCCIASHMWPINFKEYPRTREAKELSYHDKRTAIIEASTSIRYKKAHREKYLKHLEKLFD